MFIIGIMGIFFLFPKPGYSEDQSAGFYAGPLSAVVKVISKKIKPGSKTGSSITSESLEESDNAVEKEAPLPSKANTLLNP